MERTTKLNVKTEESNRELNSLDNLIYLIRGQQVMVDRDLARLYGVETRVLNQAVKRNKERFPEDFMFQLQKDEAEGLGSQNTFYNSRSQNEILKQGQNLKYLPYVFTENGVAMLSSVLRSKTAIEVNIQIMRMFASMRRFLTSNSQIFQRIETIEHNQLLTQQHLSEHNKKIEEILTRLDEKELAPIEGFFFEGQIFDAYTLISDLVRKASRRIVLIDNYVDDRVLKTLDKRKEGVAAVIYTNPKNSQIELDLIKHNAQYSVIELRQCSNVHDRFLILDETVYFIGGSIKDLGKKIVAFSKMSLNPEEIVSKIR